MRIKAPRRTRYQLGRYYEAEITGKGASVFGGETKPALRITRHEGPGVLDWSDVHFSTAKTTQTLRRRMEKFAESIGQKPERIAKAKT